MPFLTIGFDLGTSTTKVVIRDSEADSVAPCEILFGEDKDFFLPTVLFKNQNELIVGKSNEAKEAVHDIKLALIENRKNCILDAASFIACTLSAALNWFLRVNPDTSRKYGTEIRLGARQDEGVWAVNIGVPCEHSRVEHNELLNRFRLALRIGFIVATLDKPITKRLVLDEALNAKLDDRYYYHRDYFQAVPEIVAQLADYTHSPRRSQGMHALVDVGASTVDIALLSISQNSLREDAGYNVYFSKVIFQGVHQLIKIKNNLSHAQLLDWLTRNGGVGASVPQSVLNGGFSEVHPSTLTEQLMREFVVGVKSLKDADPNNTGYWKEKGIRTFVTGGGSYCRIYRDVIAEANKRLHSLGAAGYRHESFPLTIGADNYLRTSVAHGLSRNWEELRRFWFKDGPPEGYRPDDHEDGSDIGLSMFDKDAG